MITEELYKAYSERAKQLEGEKLKIYDDGHGVPTIGVGFALVLKVKEKKWVAREKKALQEKGIDLNEEQYKIIEEYAEEKSSGSGITSSLQSKLQAMRNYLKNIVFLILFIILSLAGNSVMSVEFAREADKAEWIKEFFKNKVAKPNEYVKKRSKKELAFEEQLFKDFITQNGIEYIEPIAVGKSINDPEIAKFNVACPDKKPINLYRVWLENFGAEQYPATEEELEDPNNAFVTTIDEYKCTGNLKVFQFNVFNRPDHKKDYVLYCDNFLEIRTMGKVLDEFRVEEPKYIESAYLYFDPGKCLYSDRLSTTLSTHMKDFSSSIYKYKGQYYFYAIYTYSDDDPTKEETYLEIWKRGKNNSSIFYGKYYYNK